MSGREGVGRGGAIGRIVKREGKGEKTMGKRGIVRQGDVLLLPVDDVSGDEAPAAKDARGLVLAEGETSGHHHALIGRGAKLFRFRAEGRQEMIVVVGRGGAEVRVIGGESGGVPRHHRMPLGAGKYLARGQRQWTSEDEARSIKAAD